MKLKVIQDDLIEAEAGTFLPASVLLRKKWLASSIDS